MNTALARKMRFVGLLVAFCHVLAFGASSSGDSKSAAENPRVMAKFLVFPPEIDLMADSRANVQSVQITRVTKNSIAERSGLRVGMVVLQINGVPMKDRTIDDLRREILLHYDSAGVTFTIYRFWGGPREIRVPWKDIGATSPPPTQG
jgi:S1-C subfamily serine protease